MVWSYPTTIDWCSRLRVNKFLDKDTDLHKLCNTDCHEIAHHDVVLLDE